MSLRERILADIKVAMKAKDAGKVAVLRFCQSALKNKEIDQRPQPLTEDDVLSVLKKLVKQRKDSIEQFGKANRQDLVDKESAELVILQSYMPELLSEAQVESFVDEAVAEMGANSMKQMGAVMKVVLEKTKGNADNKLVSQLVKAKLS